MHRFSILLSLGIMACESNVTPKEPVEESDDIVVQDLDGDGYEGDEDCDDSDASINIDALEVCDGIDNNCDGAVDEDVLNTFFKDQEADGFGSDDDVAVACEAPQGYDPNGSDCNDEEASIFPGATEICDEVDNDCNELVDDGVGEVHYQDLDGDGFGDPMVSMVACFQPNGYVLDSTDCDDNDPLINPDTVWYSDVDGDGFPGSFYITSCTETGEYVFSTSDDCNDLDPTVYPGALEYCDSIDQDCDSETQDADSVDALTWYIDLDGDGFGDVGSPVFDCVQPSGAVSNATDCDDTNILVFPRSHEIEIPFDGIDTDCDGYDVCKDINCDAWPDIITPKLYDEITGYSIDNYIYFGSANGYSNSSRQALEGFATSSADHGDFNGDGYVDVLLTSFGTSGDTQQDSILYYGSSSGLDSVGINIMNNYGTHRSCVADLDADGFDDIVQASHFNGTYSTTSYIYWGSANGIIENDNTPLESQSPFDCSIDDLNQDGYLDIYLPAYMGMQVSYIYWGSSSAVYDVLNRTELMNMDEVTRAKIEDVNLDGYSDILFGSNASPSGVVWGGLSGYSMNNFDGVNQLHTADVAATDLNGDGLYDLVTCKTLDDNGIDFSDVSTIYWNSPSGISSVNATSLEVDGCTNVDITDANQDGYPDIVFVSHLTGSIYNYTHNTTSYIYYGSATGYSAYNRDALQSYGSNSVTIADLNFDGYPDLIKANYIDASNSTNVDSFIYWGGVNGYSGNRTTIDSGGIWSEAIVVGNVSQ